MNSKIMNTENREEIDRLITLFLNGEAGKEEIDLLKQWIESSSENLAYFQGIRNVWAAAGARNSSDLISTDDALHKVLRKLDRKRIVLQYLQRIAAVMFIPLLAFSIWQWNNKANAYKSGSITYNEITAAFGTRSLLTLSDGSKVWLNAGSKLLYPDKFINNQRVVYLTGEAFFEVQSDKERPFIVKSNHMSVVATGTQFDVMAYSNQPDMKVILAEGKVTVNKMKANGKVAHELGRLMPNQLLIFDTLTCKAQIASEDIYKYIAWKEGKLVFRNDPMAEVVKKISQFYNVDIELQGDKLKEYRYRATFEEESVYEILKLLKLSSPINYREIDRKPFPDGSFPKRKIIIFPNN